METRSVNFDVALFDLSSSLANETCGEKGNPKRQRGTKPGKSRTNADVFLAYASGFLIREMRDYKERKQGKPAAKLR
jgi:hypothetical protein